MRRMWCALIVVVLGMILGAKQYVMADNTVNLSGDGTKKSPYLISSAEDLFDFADMVNQGNDFNGKYIKQTANIDLEGAEWEPIAPYESENYFNGIYDGDGHYVKNLNISTDGNNGFFGKLGGAVMNFGIESGYIKGKCVGSITSHSSSSSAVIINCYNKATVEGTRAGGIADNFNGSIVNCWSDCDLVSESGQMGGIVSYTALIVENCYVIEHNRKEIEVSGAEIVNLDNDWRMLVQNLNDDIWESANLVGIKTKNLKLWEVDAGVLKYSEDHVSLTFSSFPLYCKAIWKQVFPWILIVFSMIFAGYVTMKYYTDKNIAKG